MSSQGNSARRISEKLQAIADETGRQVVTVRPNNSVSTGQFQALVCPECYEPLEWHLHEDGNARARCSCGERWGAKPCRWWFFKSKAG